MADSNERAEKGREILKSRAAQGEAGTKQPAHKEAAIQAQQVVDDLKAVAEKHGAKPRGPSASKENGNNPIPAHERTFAPPVGGTGMQAAAGAVAAAAAHIESEMIAEARIQSDPRWESDQKKFEMGMRGELAFVPAITQDEKDHPPTTSEEQAALDKPKLEKAEQTAKEVKGGNLTPVTHTERDNVKDAQIRTGAGKPVTPIGTKTPTPTLAMRAAEAPSGQVWDEATGRYILISG